MPESTACRENNTPIWKRHHDANPTLQVVLSNKAKDAIRAASPSHPPGTALTEEAPPQASSDLQPPEFSPSEAAPPSPPNYQPSGIDGTETVRTTSGQGREWCQYSSPMRRKAPGSQHVSGKAPQRSHARAFCITGVMCRGHRQSCARSTAHSCLPVECGREAQEGEGSIRRRHTAFPRRAARRQRITATTPLSMIASMVMLNMCTLERGLSTGVQVEDRCRLRQGSFEKTTDPQSRA